MVHGKWYMRGKAMFSFGSHFYASGRPTWNLAKFQNREAPIPPPKKPRQTVAIIAPLHLSARLSDRLRCAISTDIYKVIHIDTDTRTLANVSTRQPTSGVNSTLASGVHFH